MQFVIRCWPLVNFRRFYSEAHGYREDTIHQSYPAIGFEVLKNDTGSNIKVVEVNEWSEKGAKVRKLDIDFFESANYNHTYGSVRYFPKKGFSGKDSFWYVIEDDQGRKNAVRVVVKVKPFSLALPAPRNDAVEVPKNKSIRIDVLANDLFTDNFVSVIEPRDWDLDLVIKLNSAYSQKGAKIKVIPNYPNHPVIRYSKGVEGPDKIWYTIEDAYGRRNYSYVKVNVTNDP